MANTNTSTQQGTKSGGIKGPAIDMVFLNFLNSEIHAQLKQNFPTLGANPNAFVTVLGIIGTETGRNVSIFNVKRQHPTVSKITGTGNRYWNHPVIKAARKRLGDGNANLLQGLQAHSLMAVMGWNNVRGLDDLFPALLKEYYTLANNNFLLVDPGTSIDDIYPTGTAGARRALIAGMIMLESKYKIFLNKKLSPQKALVAATRAYLGVGVDQTGTTTTKYLATVSSIGLKLAAAIGKPVNPSRGPLSSQEKSPVQISSVAKVTQPNLVDLTKPGYYLPPGPVNTANMSPQAIQAAGLEPKFVAGVPAIPGLSTPQPQQYVLAPGEPPNYGYTVPVASPASTINGATADSSGVLNTQNTLTNPGITRSDPVLNLSGTPLYYKDSPVPKPPLSFLDAGSGLKNISGVTFPVGPSKPVGPLYPDPIINANTGMPTYGGSLTNDPATFIAALPAPNGVMETKSSVAATEAPISNATPVPQPGC